MKHFLSVCLLLAHLLTWAQGKEMDSLQKLLPSLSADTQKVNILNRLARLAEAQDPPRSLKYALEARGLAQTLNFRRGIAFSLVYEADYYYFQGQSDTAEKKYEQAIRLFKSVNDKMALAWTYMVAGNNFTSNGHYEKAIEYVLLSVKLNEEAGNTTGYAWSLETAGSIFAQLGQFDKASEYTQKSLALMRDLGNPEGLASCYNTLGIISDYTGDYPKALDYYEKALDLRIKSGNLVEVINIKANMGIVHHYMGDHAKALPYLKDAMRLARQAGQTASVASALINLGEVYLVLKNYTLSLASLREGIALADQLGALDYKREGVRLLSEALFAKGDYKEAFEQELAYTTIKDSILSVSSRKQIFEMNSKYESEKKDRELLQKDAEISRQTADSRQKSLQRNSFIVAFGVMLLCAFFILRGYRQKQRISVEITRQKDIIEEKQKEILDSIHYARRIQRALITPEKYIERVLNARTKQAHG